MTDDVDSKGPAQKSISERLLKRLHMLDEMLTFLATQESGDDYIESLWDIDVVSELSAGERQQLSNLVARFTAESAIDKRLAALQQERSEWARYGDGRIKKLRAKLADARSAIQAVRSYVGGLDLTTGKSTNRVLSEAMDVLDPGFLDDAERVVASLKKRKLTDDAMLALYDFFVQRGLKKNEAEVRVGKIGNHFWDWNVVVREAAKKRNDVETWKGCEAVRKAVRRRK